MKYFLITNQKVNIISSFSVAVHAAASAVGDGVGRVQTGGGLQDGALHTVVALHSRPPHALRLEKGSVYLFSFCSLRH